MWDLESRSRIRSFTEHNGPIESLSIIDPTHTLTHTYCIITGSHDSNIKLWDMSKSSAISTLAGHVGAVHGVSADSLRIASAGSDQTVKIWDIETGKCLYTFSHKFGVSCVLISDTKLISSDLSGIVIVRDFLY